MISERGSCVSDRQINQSMRNLIFSLTPFRCPTDIPRHANGTVFPVRKTRLLLFCDLPRSPDETEQYLPDIRFDDVEDKTIQKKIQKLKKNFEMAVKILDNYARLLYYK